MEKSKGQQMGSTLGMLGGLYFAYTKKSSFWGYVGFSILGSVAGGVIGKALDPKKEKMVIEVKK